MCGFHITDSKAKEGGERGRSIVAEKGRFHSLFPNGLKSCVFLSVLCAHDSQKPNGH